MNKKAQTGEILFDILGALVILFAFIGFSYYQFGGQTHQTEAKVVEFTQELDSQQFLQSLLKSPVPENYAESLHYLTTSDLLALSLKDHNTENLLSVLIYQKLSTLIPGEEWILSVYEPLGQYSKNYFYQPSSIDRTGGTKYNTIIAKTTIPSIDAKELKITLTRYQII